MEAWRVARTTPPSTLSPAERRALLVRAEREARRRIDQLRAAELQRYGEKDRALADLARRAEVRVKRRLIATAWWRCA